LITIALEQVETTTLLGLSVLATLLIQGTKNDSVITGEAIANTSVFIVSGVAS